jgi:2-succinyl-5-enolpyruvyl-6-hydroxy-3-cyclohexene-1-carboxylate synthase
MGDSAIATYEFCGAFFSELKAAGVVDAVVSPGHRSAPLTISADRAALRLWVQIDERSAGFFALGMARAHHRPVALVCTSGTAAANYLPAVIEASRSLVPLIVLTADRPPELRGWGSNQTIDQLHIYGSNPRWFAEMPVASESEPSVARRFAARAAAVAGGMAAGPVHLNFPLRPPLQPDTCVPSEFFAPERPISTFLSSAPSADLIAPLVEAIDRHERGVILAGALNPGSITPQDMFEVAGNAGWPIIAEPTSQLRVAAKSSAAAVVCNGNNLVQVPSFAEAHHPDTVVLIGAPPPTRALRAWLKGGSKRVLVVGEGPEWADETLAFTDAIRSDPGSLFGAVRNEMTVHDNRESWSDAWRSADALAASALDHALIDSSMFEGRVVKALAGVIPDGVPLYVGNSLAVRDLNRYWPPRDEPIDIYSNRGASGIDGMVSSALGVAAASAGPVVLLLGDLSLLHDLSGLLTAVRLEVPLVIVVTNNDGGGIFSSLPIRELDRAIRFGELFHTPHGADLGAVVTGLGGRHLVADSSISIQRAVAAGLEADGPTAIEVQIDAAASVTTHRAIDARVRRALAAEQ